MRPHGRRRAERPRRCRHELHRRRGLRRGGTKQRRHGRAGGGRRRRNQRYRWHDGRRRGHDVWRIGWQCRCYRRSWWQQYRNERCGRQQRGRRRWRRRGQRRRSRAARPSVDVALHGEQTHQMHDSGARRRQLQRHGRARECRCGFELANRSGACAHRRPHRESCTTRRTTTTPLRTSNWTC
jgi:hypothetical protein